jgi:arylsulfatase A-like enzyme
VRIGVKKTRREFLQSGTAATAAVMLPQTLAAAMSASRTDYRPNIIMILADDMGFSDTAPYGSEISTPNLDKLAHGGIKFTQFYNNPRCCPSRASLMTGLYSQQAGMGLMTADYGRYPYPGYKGDLSDNCVTIAEALRSAGYRTAISGKWHLTPNQPNFSQHNWPLQRGFDKFFGTIEGAGSYHDPASLARDNQHIPAGDNFYYTDAIGENAISYIDEFSKGHKPFFLYTAFTAPHWPLQAFEEDIAKYKDRYRDGWDKLRRDRHTRQLRMGIVEEKWGITDRDPRVPAWENASYKEWEIHRMAVYAAMIERMDRNIGLIVAKLEMLGIADNTLVMFMSDNGGNFEEIGDPGDKVARPPWIPYKTHDGQPVIQGNKPDIMPGPEKTYQSIGIPWGNCANTPFRLYKHYAHEGGIATPFIAHWPKGIKQANSVTHQLGHETDIMATCLDLAKLPYPSQSKSGEQPPALAGTSLRPIFEGRTRTDRGPMFWEHEGNAAMRDGKWKLVSRFPDAWELHDMEADRTELHNVADLYPDRVKTMAADYHSWAERIGVKNWPMPETPAGERDGAMTSPPYLRHDRP